MTPHELKLARDLARVLAKHHARIDERDEYDGADRYIGTTYTVKTDDIELGIKDIADFVNVTN